MKQLALIIYAIFWLNLLSFNDNQEMRELERQMKYTLISVYKSEGGLYDILGIWVYFRDILNMLVGK